MTISVGLVAAFAVFVLHLPLGVGVLLGAILAPTDPVLASDVQVHDAGDRDRLRFSLTGEGGLNDGTAFPFVMLGLGQQVDGHDERRRTRPGVVDAHAWYRFCARSRPSDSSSSTASTTCPRASAAASSRRPA